MFGFREQRDVPQDGRRLHVRPRKGNQLAGPEQAEVSMLKRGEGGWEVGRHGRPNFMM
jgi:hypothetical protein